MKGLSILLPEYNCDCTTLVRALSEQCRALALEAWEIIVADDASPDQAAVCANQQIATWDNCFFICHKQNMGRAANRNFLIQQARYSRLILIDSDMCLISPHYIATYLAEKAQVVDGGYRVMGEHKGNLRYEYEKHAEPLRAAHIRQRHPYLDFKTSNYCIDRQVALAYPLDESYRGYGFEDVAYGDQLRQANIDIWHIDNPIGFYNFEPNDDFLDKTEESLRSLYLHRQQLRPYSRLLPLAEALCFFHLQWLWSWLFRMGQRRMRSMLISRPHLSLFTLYKIGYYINFAHLQHKA